MIFFSVYAPCLRCAFRSFGETECFHLSSQPALVTLKMEALRSPETSQNTSPARRRNPKQDRQITNNRRENLKTYGTSNSYDFSQTCRVQECDAVQCGRNLLIFEEHHGLPLTTEAAGPTGTSARFYHPTGRDTPDGSNAHTHPQGNLQYYKSVTDSKARLILLFVSKYRHCTQSVPRHKFGGILNFLKSLE
jgi:hypothetical protein